MTKYLLTWNGGNGIQWKVMDVDSLDEASRHARDCCQKTVDEWAEHKAQPLTDDLADYYGVPESER
jgi:hypothetical protein